MAKLTKEAQNKLTRWVINHLREDLNIDSNVDHRRGIIKGCLKRGKPCTVYISSEYTKDAIPAFLSFDLHDLRQA